MTTVEWLIARRDHLRRRWERTTKTDLKIRYGAQKAELTRVLDYVATHPPRIEVPRRNNLDLNTTAEIAIREAIASVERVGAHPLLTEAVILLGEARERVADYVDRSEKDESVG